MKKLTKINLINETNYRLSTNKIALFYREQLTFDILVLNMNGRRHTLEKTKSVWSGRLFSGTSSVMKHTNRRNKSKKPRTGREGGVGHAAPVVVSLLAWPGFDYCYQSKNKKKELRTKLYRLKVSIITHTNLKNNKKFCISLQDQPISPCPLYFLSCGLH